MKLEVTYRRMDLGAIDGIALGVGMTVIAAASVWAVGWCIKAFKRWVQRREEAA